MSADQASFLLVRQAQTAVSNPSLERECSPSGLHESMNCVFILLLKCWYVYLSYRRRILGCHVHGCCMPSPVSSYTKGWKRPEAPQVCSQHIPVPGCAFRPPSWRPEPLMVRGRRCYTGMEHGASNRITTSQLSKHSFRDLSRHSCGFNLSSL